MSQRFLRICDASGSESKEKTAIIKTPRGSKYIAYSFGRAEPLCGRIYIISRRTTSTRYMIVNHKSL